jgi:hypothetical protein
MSNGTQPQKAWRTSLRRGKEHLEKTASEQRRKKPTELKANHNITLN